MTKKGQKNERKGSKVYERAGYLTYRPPRARGGPTDIFNLFDMAAVSFERGILRLVQFKTNGASGIQAWSEKAINYEANVPGITTEMAVRHDGEPGSHTPSPYWRLLKPMEQATNGFKVVFDERKTDNQNGDGLEKYLKEL